MYTAIFAADLLVFVSSRLTSSPLLRLVLMLTRAHPSSGVVSIPFPLLIYLFL